MAKRIIGVDEVGLGAWAGPIYVCGVLVRCDWSYDGLADSKDLSVKQHQQFWELARTMEAANALKYTVSVVELESINAEGPGKPMKRAKLDVIRMLRQLDPEARVVVDGELEFPEDLEDCWAAPKADSYVPACMLASNVAKHLRDSLMFDHAKKFPHYGFETNVGYGTPKHREAIARHGVSPIHRTSYAPIQQALKKGTIPADQPGLEPVSKSLYDGWRSKPNGG
jgi:ribonuclease HII